MRLIHTHDVPTFRLERACRESKRGAQIGPLVCFGAAGLAFLPSLAGASANPLWLLGILSAALGALQLPALVASLRPGRWLVRMGEDGLAFRLRSPRNRRLPEDAPTVAVLVAPEIRAVRTTTEVRECIGRNGRPRSLHWTYLDFRLAPGTAAELAAALAADRSATATHPAYRRHHPVRVVDGEWLRVDWSSIPMRVRPGPTRMLARLAQAIPVEPAHFLGRRFAEHMEGQELASYLGLLLDSGGHDAALRLACLRYGVDEERAKELLGRGLPASPEAELGAEAGAEGARAPVQVAASVR